MDDLHVLKAKLAQCEAELAVLRAGKPPAPPTQQKEKKEEGSVKVVLQRADNAEILLDNANHWERVGRCLIVYLSFSKGASSESLPRAVSTILRLPLVTMGRWATHKQASAEDAPKSVLACVQETAEAVKTAQAESDVDGSRSPAVSCEGTIASRCPVSVVVIPQAGLTSKIGTGRANLKYHSQAPKELSRRLFDEFVSLLRAQAHEAVYGKRKDLGALGKKFTDKRAERAAQAAVDPAVMFRSMTDKYSAWDEIGIPTVDAAGEPIAKSQLKKLKKQYEAQRKKWAKRQLSIGDAATSAGASATSASAPAPAPPPASAPVHAPAPAPDVQDAKSVVDSPTSASVGAEEVLKVVAGTFGNRQGFRMAAECGPFTHTFAF